ncbi:Membrane protein involved in aromatic hydrocarbon degradation [Candidatus Magnetomorum sp. HK-1]|nr:Membrane protein involved in aromatic hydrocarbon degradation [Candidatus Magnetomorum sp. HK-1]
MKNYLYSIISACCILLLYKSACSSDYEFPSSFCTVGSGARATGMCAYIAISDDSTAPAWNPGAFSQQEEPFEASIVFASFYRSEINSIGENLAKHHVTDVNINYFSVVSSFESFERNMSIALSYQHLYDMNRNWSFPYIKHNDYFIRNEQWNYEQNGLLSALGVSYCIEIIRSKLSCGFTLNFWDNDLTPNRWRQTYEMTGTGIFDDERYTERLHKTEDYQFKGFNMNFGLLWTVNYKLTFGAVLKTPFNASIEHDISYNNVIKYPQTEGRDDDIYLYNEKLHEHLKMPLSYGIGMVYKFSDIFYMSFDLYRTHWNNYIYTDQDGNQESPISKTSLSESDVNPTHQVRMGIEYLLLDTNTQSAIPLRAGLFYDPAPAEKNPDDFYGFSLGTGYVKNDICSLDISYVYRMGNDVASSLLKDEDFSQNVREHMVYVSSIIYFF